MNQDGLVLTAVPPSVLIIPMVRNASASAIAKKGTQRRKSKDTLDLLGIYIIWFLNN